MKLISLVIMTLLVWGCREKQVNNSTSEPQQKIKPAPQLSVTQIGELRFRKSYAGHQDMTDKQFRKLEKSNPKYYYGSEPDSISLDRFRALGYLNKNYELLTKKIDSFKIFNVERPDTTFNLADNLNNKISCQIKKADSPFMYDLVVADNVQRTLFKVNYKFILPGLRFRTADIAPGGLEEVILLDEYYIINGDNYDFFIYEITYK